MKRAFIINTSYFNFDTNAKNIGGVESYIYSLSKVLRTIGYDVSVLQTGYKDAFTQFDEEKIYQYKTEDKKLKNKIAKLVAIASKQWDAKTDLLIFATDTIISKRKDKTIYKDGNRTIKLFDETYSKADVLNEALNQSLIETETDLHIAKVEEVTKIDGKWAIILDYIEGETLDSLMDKNPEKEDEYLELFVNLQLEMHKKTAPDLKKLKDKMNRKISQTDLDATTRYELHTRLEGMPKHKKVCHGDFNPSNIIITPDGTPFIIDWAHATQGNASADVARSYLLFSLAGKTELAEKYLNLFCNKSDTAKQYVQKWIPIVAASQSVKNNPEERDFLMRWVDVVDYE